MRGANSELRDLDRQVDRAAARIKNVTAAMAAAGFSEALLAQLKTEEAALAAAKARRAAASRGAGPKVLPHPRVIESISGPCWTRWIATGRALASFWPATCRPWF
jgi:hypothetical protein